MRKYNYEALADAADALNDATEDCRECPVQSNCNCDKHGCMLDAISEILRDNACLADAYQAAAQRTSGDHDKILNGVLGLSGETGECADIVKKATFQGHVLDRDHLIDEASDVAWYLAELATGLGVSLSEIFRHNVEKLKKRYPDGFDPERSIHREGNENA